MSLRLTSEMPLTTRSSAAGPESWLAQHALGGLHGGVDGGGADLRGGLRLGLGDLGLGGRGAAADELRHLLLGLLGEALGLLAGGGDDLGRLLLGLAAALRLVAREQGLGLLAQLLRLGELGRDPFGRGYRGR